MLEPIQEQWDETVKLLNRKTQENIINGLKLEYGEFNFEQKLVNFKALGPKPFSIVAFHNRFLAQARNAFVIGAYYPSLTAACALGERILNHLIINLRDQYKSHVLYKKVYKKESFDDWFFAIDVLRSWEILTVDTVADFMRLCEKRNNSVHFNSATEINDRQLALDAIKDVEQIVQHQFAGFGVLPWLLPGHGECYIKKEWEKRPFVLLAYVPNSTYVGYKHTVEEIIPDWKFSDADDYPNEDVTDQEFLELRRKYQEASRPN
jgi:hypothetical protein